MTDTTDNMVLQQSYESDTFQKRCRLRFLTAAVSITNESSATPNHASRLQLCGALFNNTVGLEMLAMVVLASSTNRSNCLANPAQDGGNVIDIDIDNQVSSTFTGIATSRSW